MMAPNETLSPVRGAGALLGRLGFKAIPWERVKWVNFVFLGGTLLLAVTVVPAHLWFNGLPWYGLALFLGMTCATGLSITFGYHRLFAHRSFEANPVLKWFCLLFGAAAFEGSALEWVSDHRRHHKHVDHEEDPYDITKGLFHAHIGWLLFKLRPEPPYDNVPDLERDPAVMWQHRNCVWVGIVVGAVLPSLAGWLCAGWPGALTGLLLGGILRLVCVQHCTFCINSLCHYIGNRPYSQKCSARDSAWMALVTFGEGYHNYHHEFQHDYRNGVKPWQWDPTKWLIWVFSKVGWTRRRGAGAPGRDGTSECRSGSDGGPFGERLNRQPGGMGHAGQPVVVGQKQITARGRGAGELDGIGWAQGGVFAAQLGKGQCGRRVKGDQRQPLQGCAILCHQVRFPAAGGMDQDLAHGQSGGRQGVVSLLHERRQGGHFPGVGLLFPEINEEIGVPENFHDQSCRRDST
jgi:stearoyl-CoA desaturase (Delta-9 desaturase)